MRQSRQTETNDRAERNASTRPINGRAGERAAWGQQVSGIRSTRLRRTPEIQPDLIIDVGAHNGDDTAHYLQRGFRVVAIEANPALARAVTARFREQVASGTLAVLNVGISAAPGRQPFWVSEDNSVLSSFDRHLVERHGGR